MKTILITGASSGIGHATAKYFAENNWNVIATMRKPDEEKELRQFQNVLLAKLDVTNSEEIRNTIELGIDKFGKIDAILNNAGYGLTGAFEAATPEQIQKQFDVNVFGTMNVIREILPHFRKNKSGIILNISSIGGKIALPTYSLYHATKFAIEGFSESLQHELRQFNIKIKLIEPGVIKTNFYTDSMVITKKEGLKDYDNYVSKRNSTYNSSGQNGAEPIEVAKVIFKAANSNSWKLRYPASGGARWIILARKLLPDGIFSWIVRGIN